MLERQFSQYKRVHNNAVLGLRVEWLLKLCSMVNHRAYCFGVALVVLSFLCLSYRHDEDAFAGVRRNDEFGFIVDKFTDKYHVILMYEALAVSALCTVESLVSGLLKGNVSSSTAVVYVWLSRRDQQEEFFDALDKRIEAAVSKRKVYVVRKEINFEEEIKGTVLDSFYKSKRDGELGLYGEQNKGNALRLALVQKYGGMYMDADMIVIDDPTGLPDGVAMESDRKFNNAVFKFHQPNHEIVSTLLDNLVENYDGDIWGQQGPLLFTRVLRRCKKKKDTDLLTCGAAKINIWEKDRFYPYSWYQARLSAM